MDAPLRPLQQTLMLLDKLANQSLSLWEIPAGATARLINVSENATFLVEAGRYRSILRIHRENYHSRNAIECELAWVDALREQSAVTTPKTYIGKDGQRIQAGIVAGLPTPRFMVLFHFVEGRAPDPDGDLEAQFETLGQIAARTHLHSMDWPKPSGFERLVWDENTVFGDRPTWGNWRDGPEVSPEIRVVLERVEDRVKDRLKRFGKGAGQFGLIHADMRLANLLVDDTGTRLIDFDDCGMGWFLYDFAAAISFIEDHPGVPAMKAAWIRGYRTIRDLSETDIREMDSFVMLRRMALLAWIGSHIEAPEPQELAPDFAWITAQLGQRYLMDYSSE